MGKDGRSRGGEGFDTLGKHMKQTDALFKKLEAGEHPDFLAVMAGISEMVAFYTDHDINVDICEIEKFLTSGKKCRFCS